MNRAQLKQMYIELTMHPSFDNLSERYQDILTYLSDGWTIVEVSRTFGLCDRAISTTRHSIFKAMGFMVYDNGKTRAMTSEEVAKKINLKL